MQNTSWLVGAVAALGAAILLWSIWTYFIAPWLPKKQTPKGETVQLIRGSYTFTGQVTSYPQGRLVKGAIYTAGDGQREPFNIHFWIPVGMEIGQVSLHYHSSSLHKGFALVDEVGRNMYLPNTAHVIAFSL
jgi:hypothetical protein